jgi:Holliday junction resolvase RusA-like endonuclease
MDEPLALVISMAGTPRALPRGKTPRGRIKPVSLTGPAKAYAEALGRVSRGVVLNVGESTVQQAFAGRALSVSILWKFKSPHPGMWGQLHTPKPDRDNLEKLVLDCLERAGALGGNDSRVAKGPMEKQWARVAGVHIRVEVAGAAELFAPGDDVLKTSCFTGDRSHD